MRSQFDYLRGQNAHLGSGGRAAKAHLLRRQGFQPSCPLDKTGGTTVSKRKARGTRSAIDGAITREYSDLAPSFNAPGRQIMIGSALCMLIYPGSLSSEQAIALTAPIAHGSCPSRQAAVRAPGERNALVRASDKP